jgi:hypothetical protein
MGAVIGEVENNDIENLFFQPLSSLLNIGRGADGIIGRQRVGQIADLSFILTDQQQLYVCAGLIQ